MGRAAGFPQGHLEPSGYAAWLLWASQGSSPGNNSSSCACVSPRLPRRQQCQQGSCSGVPAIAVCHMLGWIFEFLISAFFVLCLFAVQSSMVSFLSTHSAFVLWGLGLPNSLASVMFHGKVFEGGCAVCHLLTYFLLRVWNFISIEFAWVLSCPHILKEETICLTYVL